MNHYRDEGLSPGDIGDPVADSIRAEMNRDAAPSKEEARQQHRKHLRETGCRVDGCDVDDPDDLGRQPREPMPSCYQQPRNVTPDIVCTRHRFSGHSRHIHTLASKIHTERNDIGAVVVYECGGHTAVHNIETEDPRKPETLASAPLEHYYQYCGAEVDYILYNRNYAYDSDS